MKFSLEKIACGMAGVVAGFGAFSFVHALGTQPLWARAETTPLIMSAALKAAIPQETIYAVYPLYSAGISWSPKVRVSLPPHSMYNPTGKIISGYQATSLPTASTDDIGALVGPLRHSYDQLLLKKGWAIDTNFEADGPGGSLWGFTKGNEILILSYTSTFYNDQPGVPEECPCTVVFTIIGGTLE